jgi:hypothetical protein
MENHNQTSRKRHSSIETLKIINTKGKDQNRAKKKGVQDYKRYRRDEAR